ncbi:hypothetical protein CEXT_536641, partial [Caerostris extrusa]
MKTNLLVRFNRLPEGKFPSYTLYCERRETKEVKQIHVIKPCQNGGSCIQNDDQARCFCEKPFNGANCEIGPCQDFNCENEGVCEVWNNEPSCNCKEPFTGDNCEIGPCVGYECEHNGICEVLEGKPQCKCKDPFTGEKCEREMNVINITVHTNVTIDYAIYGISRKLQSLSMRRNTFCSAPNPCVLRKRLELATDGSDPKCSCAEFNGTNAKK